MFTLVSGQSLLNWICDTCGDLNYYKNVICDNCESEKLSIEYENWHPTLKPWIPGNTKYFYYQVLFFINF